MKKQSALEDNFTRFILNHQKGISIDCIQDKFRKKDGQNHKMADFLLENNKFILEMKSLFSDRSENVINKVNSLVESDEWLSKNWFGAVPLEELIQKHPDSKIFRKKIMNFAYDNIKNKVIKEAHKQIGTTKEVLILNDSIGGLILLNDNVASHETKYLSDEILSLLETRNYLNVEFVIYICHIEKHVDFCLHLDSKSKNKEFIEWYVNNKFLLNWASFNGFMIQQL